MVVHATELLLVFLTFAAWGFGAVLQWRNIRRQERLIAGLTQMCLTASRQAAQGKAPRLGQEPVRSEFLRCRERIGERGALAP